MIILNMNEITKTNPKLKFIEEIRDFPNKNSEFLEQIISKLNSIFNEKRKIMFSDIINFIAKEGLNDTLSNRLILWCSYKIRLGGVFLDD
jgi:hypothetical protein